MGKLILYHGTSKENAEKIEKEGFIIGKSYNWKVKSKKGFVYLSIAYAPFYAMNCDSKGKGLALIKIEVNEKDLYPDEDFIMFCLKKPIYTENDLIGISLEKNKNLWKESLQYMGNVAIKTGKIKIIGIKYFDGKHLIMKCDPSITPINFKMMGDYYKELSDWIFDGKDILKFKGFGDLK